ncbi:DUF1493 family protein [Rahnella sikkimica]|uniref:Uncharacterized protein n=1 Tax=Rahnella sikkimica TaxID=1805933 RepID=A0A2L1UKG8_9GAMM|nr:DUF1493 family protein [Rahnella sikkimica]AVF33427.1 hypothetical protein BV494_00110 [Rahnella sikkimica]
MVSNEEFLQWYCERFNTPSVFFNKRWPVTIDTGLSTGKYVWASETGGDTMNEYFEKYDVAPSGFDFYRYWPVETFILFGLCTCGNDDDEPQPLKLKMLAESARA